MSRYEPCELTNMCMICDGSRVLVQRRTDPAWPGISFPGGHVDKGESFVDSVIREVKEETGLDIADVKLCGMSQWTARDGAYRYIVLFYKTDTFSGELRSSEEGEVFWVELSELKNMELAGNFGDKLEIFLDDKLSENYFWFENGDWQMKNV